MFLNLGNSVLNNYIMSTVLNIEMHLRLFGLIFELNKLRILNVKVLVWKYNIFFQAIR